MSLLDFTEFALTRAETKRVVGGFSFGCSGSCTGYSYNGQTQQYETTTGVCQTQKSGKGKTKTTACNCTAGGGKANQC
jgi:hypothetical protein